MKPLFVFPGQGSQAVGMGAELSGCKAFGRLEEASDLLGFDLKLLCLEGPLDQLTLTENAQPAILAISIIAFENFRESCDLEPLFVAGHSLGEYSALVAAGVMSYADAIQTVHARGKLMQSAVPPGQGAMAAVLGHSADEVDQVCAEVCQQQAADGALSGEIVAAANYNTPGQIVISGHSAAVDQVLTHLKGKRLPVSAPFHSVLMQPAQDGLQKVLEGVTFRDASCPVISNVDNRLLTRAQDFADSLTRQVTSSVLWDSGILKVQEQIDTLIEFGYGSVLTGMMKRIDKTKRRVNIYKRESVDEFLSTL